MTVLHADLRGKGLGSGVVGTQHHSDRGLCVEVRSSGAKKCTSAHKWVDLHWGVKDDIIAGWHIGVLERKRLKNVFEGHYSITPKIIERIFIEGQ